MRRIVLIGVLAALAVALAQPAGASVHAICSGPHAATQPCYFSTPQHNVRCRWTPSPNVIICDVVTTHRAFKLAPTGAARHAIVSLPHPGDVLPTSQQIVFPDSLSCHDTATRMTCNQDFGSGEFTLP
jgi:hypothetical protein